MCEKNDGIQGGQLKLLLIASLVIQGRKQPGTVSFREKTRDYS